jgi:hypothetical protein
VVVIWPIAKGLRPTSRSNNRSKIFDWTGIVSSWRCGNLPHLARHYCASFSESGPDQGRSSPRFHLASFIELSVEGIKLITCSR